MKLKDRLRRKKKPDGIRILATFAGLISCVIVLLFVLSNCVQIAYDGFVVMGLIIAVLSGIFMGRIFRISRWFALKIYPYMFR